MTRSNAREVAVHMIYELGFGSRSAEELLEHEMTRERFAQLGEEEPLYAQFPNEKQRQYIRDLVQGVYVHGPELDDYISRYSVGWSFARIPRMAAAVMRTAMYEVLYMPAIPNSAAINEAVEIAKNYEPAEVVSFINGILGSFVRAEFADSAPKPEKEGGGSGGAGGAGGMTMPVLGLDTSNYTTSAAVFDGADGCNAGRLLAVRPGELGLRQSDALFQHVKQLPALLEELEGRGLLRGPEGSGGQHPAPDCGGLLHALLPGGGVPWKGAGRRPLGCRFLPAPTSRGTWRRRPGPPGGRTCWTVPSWPGTCPAAPPSCCWSGPRGTNVAAEAGRDQRHLRWPAHRPHRASCWGFSSPAGKALDELYPQADACMEYRVKLKDLTFSLSGMENQVKRLLAEGEAPANVARFTPWTRCAAWSSGPPRRPSAAAPACRCSAPAVWPPTDSCGPPWRGAAAPCSPSPCYSTDNAMGVAILTRRALEGRGSWHERRDHPHVPPR